MAIRVGLRKTSLVDYPGRIASTLFFPGCNLRCPWCHNRELVLPRPEENDGLMDLEEAVSIVEARRSLIGGVVLTGGEPTLQHDLASVLARFKKSGIPVKLDTNGTRSDALERLFADEGTKPDYVALDLKLALDRYGELLVPATGSDGEGKEGRSLAASVRRSAELLASSGIPHEFRSLALGDEVFAESDVAALAAVVDEGAWYFSPFRPGNCLDEEWNRRPGGEAADARRLAEVARSFGKRGEVRSA